MKCVLCLKEFSNTNPHIIIFSVKGDDLSARLIIEKHFWMQVDEAEEDKNLICRFCWKKLHSFHMFYTRIEDAHKSLEQMKESNLIKTEKATEIVYGPNDLTPVKEESNVNNANESYPRMEFFKEQVPETIVQYETFEEFPYDILDNSKSDAILDTHEKDKNKCERSQKEKEKTQVSNAHSSSTKTEVFYCSEETEPATSTQNECIDNFEFDDMSNSMSTNDESDTIVDTESKPKVKKLGRPRKVKNEKVNKSQKTIKSMEYDEIIAKHFKLYCCICKTELANFNEVKSHFRLEHNIRGYVECCGKKLLKRGVLVDHIYTHQDPNYFACPKCDKVLTTRRSLELHLKGHEIDRRRIYQCNVCQKSYFNLVVYNRHLQLHIPEEEKTIPCPECSKTFSTKYNMTQHLKLVHLKLYAKVCDICGKSIRGIEAFKRHQELHEGIETPLFECKLCGVSLTTKYGLARHKKMRHTEKYTQSQECPICAKISPSLMAHNCHMKFVHSMTRKYACTLCEKAFKRPKDLREHMTIHTGEILYKCTHCTKTFNSNANMYAHRKRAHPKEWEANRQKRSQLQKDNGTQSSEPINSVTNMEVNSQHENDPV